VPVKIGTRILAVKNTARINTDFKDIKEPLKIRVDLCPKKANGNTDREGRG
jgi:hypothetical protein